MRQHRYTLLLIYLLSSISQKNVNSDGELSSNKYGKPNIKITVILSLFTGGDDVECWGTFLSDALQNVEALYYALDLIQKDDTLSEKFNLSVDVIEYCNSPGIEIKYLPKLYDQLSVESIDHDYHENATFGLIYDSDSTILNYENIFKKVDAFPHISYSGLPTKMSDVDVIPPEYPFDFITATSGHIFIADVIMEILKRFKWEYVKLLHHHRTGPSNSDEQMVRYFERRFEELAMSNNVCLIKESWLEAEALKSVPMASHTRIVDIFICYCSQTDIKMLKNQLENSNKTYVVIVGNMDPFWMKEVTWNSTLGDLYYVTPTIQYNEDFYYYYTSLSVKNYTRHPYLKKFRKRYFDERLDSKTTHEEMSNGTHRNIYQNNSNAAVNIIKSLYAMAHVVKQMFDSAQPWRSRNIAASELRQIKFELFNENISFTKPSGLPRVEKFDVHKFQEIRNESGNFIRFAEYFKTNHTEYHYSVNKNRNLRIEGILNILDAGFQNKIDFPRRRCSEPCPAGQFRKNHDNPCCWNCEECGHLSILHKDGTSCTECRDGLMANKNHTECVPTTLSVFLQIPTECTDVQNLLSIGLSSFSIILTAIVQWVFVKYQNTPAVKSTTRELCYIMFAGIILINTTLLISTANSNFESSDVKVLPAVGFTMIYAALLVKTNRVARLLVTPKHRFAKMNLKYLSLKAQIIMTAMLIAIEILICWFAVKFQDPSEPGIGGNNVNLKKFYLDGAFLIKIFAFVILLILLCTYYAIKTRNLPENFNEAKYIGFAMYATVLTAIAFSTVYFTSNSIKIMAMNVCASINTLTILIFLFSPKLYIILWKPERNTRVYFSPVTSSIRSYMGKESRPNPRKPLNQSYSLETSGQQSSFNNAAVNLKEYERSMIIKIIEEIDILHKEIYLDTLKDKVKTADLQLDEVMDKMQKAYSEQIQNIKLKYTVEVDQEEKSDVKYAENKTTSKKHSKVIRL